MGSWESTPETSHEDHSYSSPVDPEGYHGNIREDGGDPGDVLVLPFVCASKEVINFCRLSMIIHTICSDATRDVIKHFLGPTNIDITRQILSKTHHFKYGIRNVKIFPHEKSYFFPPANCTIDIEKADFSLMYKLFRNFDSPMLDAKEKAKWEKTPSDSDQGIVAALERIRNARNAFVAHPSSAKTDDQEFDDICKQLSISLKAIDSGLGTAHFDRIQEMKTIILDDSMVSTQLKLSESNRKLEETQRKLEASEAVDTRTEEELQNLQERLAFWLADREEQMAAIRRETELTDDQIIERYMKRTYGEDANQGNTKKFLSAKFRKEKYCVETEAFRTARQQLEEKKKLWILGKAGAGKTRLAVRLLYHFIVKCRGDIIVRKISKPSEIRNLYNANSEKNTILFVDDAFGKTVVDRNLAEKWCKAFDFINSLCKSGRATVGHLWILYTSRNYILQAASEEEVVLLKSVKDFVLDLSSQEHDLKNTEKHAILDMRIKQTEDNGGMIPSLTQEEKEVIVHSTPTIGYPLCVKLFVINQANHEYGTDFFESPIHFVLKMLTIKLQSREYHRGPYDALEDLILLMLLHNTRKRYDNESTSPNYIPLRSKGYLTDLARKFNLFTILTDDRHFHIRECAKSLSKDSVLILERDKDCFDFLHQSIADAVGIHFVKQNFNKAVSIVDIDVLMDHISLTGESSEHTGLICISPETEKGNIQILLERFKSEMLEGNIKKVVSHRVWESEKVCEIFYDLTTLKEGQYTSNDLKSLKKLLEKCDDETKKNLLISSLEEGQFRLSDLLIKLHKFLDSGSEEQKGEKSHYSADLHRLFSEALLFVCDHQDCASNACTHACCSLKVIKEMVYQETTLDYCKACLMASANEQADTKSIHQCCLEKAAYKDNSTLVIFLLEKGSTIPHVRWNGWDFLHTAAKNNEVQLCSPDFIKTLSSVKDFSKSKTNSSSRRQSTSGTYNVLRDKASDVEKFEKLAHIIHQCGDDRLQILFHFIQYLRVTTEVLMTFKSYLDLSVEEFQKAIIFHIIENSPFAKETMDILLSEPWNFNPNTKNKHGGTALTVEVMKSFPQKELVQLLLRKGANPFDIDTMSKTFLHYLLASNATDDIVSDILRIVQSLNIKLPLKQRDETGVTPLSIALTKTANEKEISQQRLQTLKVISSFKLEQHFLCEPACLPFHIIVVNRVLEEEKKMHLIDRIAVLATLEHTGTILDINTKDINGKTALMELLNCPSFSVKLFEKLIVRGANIDVYDEHGNSILHKLLSFDIEHETLKNCIYIMRSHGSCFFNINMKNEYGITPLMMAICEQKHISIVRVLLGSDAQISIDDLNGLDALHMCFQADFAIPEKHPENGNSIDDVKQNTFQRRTSMMQMDTTLDIDYSVELARHFLAYDFDLSKVDMQSRTYIHHCVASSFEDEDMASVCESLISKGIDVDWKDQDGLSALQQLLRQSPGNLKTMEILLKMSRGDEQEHAILLEELISSRQLSHGHVELLKTLNIIRRDSVDKQNIFHQLAATGYRTDNEFMDERIFRLLCTTNSVNHMDENGLTPLHIACMERASKKSIQTFINVGGDINIHTREREESLLHLIVKSQRDDFEAKVLLNMIVDMNSELLNTKSKAGYTPLAQAARCERQREIVAKYLTERGANIVASDNVKKTPMHHAVSSQRNDYKTFKFVSRLLTKSEMVETEQGWQKSLRSFRALELSTKDNRCDTVLHAVCSVTKFSRILTLTSFMNLADEETEGLHFDKLHRTPIHRIFSSVQGKELSAHPVVQLESLMRLSILLLHDIPGDAKDGDGKLYHDYCDTTYIDYVKRIQAAKDRLDNRSCQREMKEILSEILEHVQFVHHSTVTPEVLYKENGVLESEFVDFISTVASYLCEMDFDDLPQDLTLYSRFVQIDHESCYNDFVEFVENEDDVSIEETRTYYQDSERLRTFSSDSDDEYHDAEQELFENPTTFAIGED